MAETERDYGESMKYAVEILKGFKMMDWESMTTPMMMDLFGDTTSERVDATLYMQLIGSRSDVCFTVNTLS